MKRVCLALLVLSAIHSFYCNTYGKDKITLIFEIIDERSDTTVEKYSVADSSLVQRSINERLHQFYFDGFLAATILKIATVENNTICTVYKGEIYNLKHLSTGNIDKELLKRFGLSSDEKERSFQIQYLEETFRKVLNYSENTGYPFATVKLDSINITGNEISASINWWRGPLMTYDSLAIDGRIKLKRNWLQNYLNIIPGERFDQSTIDLIEEKIGELSFLELESEPEVNFYSNKARIRVNVRERKVNNVDGILGVFPNSRDGSKVLITGSLNLHLYNLFSSAKQLHLDWQKVNVNSQTLDASFYYPRFLTMPLGVNVDFNLLKEDTIYLDRNTTLAIDFKPGPGQIIAFKSQFESSNLLSDNTSELTNNQFNDYNLVYYGLTYGINRLDDFWYPQRGWKGNISGFVGQKKSNLPITESSSPNDLEEIKSTQYKIMANFEKYITLHRGYVLKLRLRSGNLFGSNIFVNDLFRIGGLKTIRGFNENYFFVSDYMIGNVEFRLMNNSDTYFFAFFDQGIVNSTIDDQETDFPFGTGLGMNLGTNSGIFSFVLAIGKSQTQIFSLNSAKIHFGYTGRF